MKIDKKITFAIIILIILMFIGAYDRIQWFNINENLLKSVDIPEDINILSVQNLVDNKSGYDIFINGIGKGLIPIVIILAPLIVGYLFSQKFTYDLNTGFGNIIITRKNFKNYFLTITIKTFVKSFIVIFCSEIIFLILCLLMFGSAIPNIDYSRVEDAIKDLYYNIPLLYCFIHICKQAVYISILSIIGMSISIFTRNRFIVSLSPFCIYLLLNIICPILDMSLNLPILKLIYPDYLIMPFITGTYLLENKILNVVASYLIYIIIMLILLCGLYKKYNNNYLK